MSDQQQATGGGATIPDKPSQAEGEREMTEAAGQGQQEGDVGDPLDKPSQAEGDPETVDAALREQERQGRA